MRPPGEAGRWPVIAPGRRRLLAQAGRGAALAALLPATAACRAFEPVAQATTPAATPTAAATSLRLNVREFGAAGDGTRDDSGPINAAIRAAVERGPGASLSFPRGRYVLGTATRVLGRTTYPTGDPGINLNNVGYTIEAHVLVQRATGLTLIGEPGALLVMKQPTASGIRLERCEDVVLRQLAIDYEPLPFTQGTIESVDEAAATFEWRLDDGFPDPTQGYLALALAARGSAGGVGIIRAAATGGIKLISGDGGDLPATDVVALGGGRFRFRALNGLLRGIAPGDRMVWPARSPDGGHAVSLKLCRRCRIEEVTVYTAPEMTFEAQDCEAITFAGCVIEPLPGSGRLLSANGDGIHCKNNRQGPVIEGCRCSGMGDDAVNISQRAPRLLRAATQTELIVEREEFLRVGDRVGAVAQDSGLTRGTASITTVRLVQWRDRVAVRAALDRPIAGLVALEALDGQTTGPVAPDLVADLDATGSRFAVRNNVFANFRGSAIKAYAADGVIENNRVEDVSRHGVRLGLDLPWQEVYHAQNVAVRNNTFQGVPWGATIQVGDRLASAKPAQGLDNHTIVIEGNVISGHGGAVPHGSGAIVVSNAQGVRVLGNTFGKPAVEGDFVPAVALDLCRDVVVEGNGGAADAGIPGALTLTERTDRDSLAIRDPHLVTAYQASAGYGATQGEQQWSYQYWDGTAYHDLTYDGASGRWIGPRPFLLVWREGQHPDGGAAVRKWTAPVTGEFAIRGRVRLANLGRGDGVRAEILHGASVLWAQDVVPANVTGQSHAVVRRVVAGEAIYFRVSQRGSESFDATLWDPVIAPLSSG